MTDHQEFKECNLCSAKSGSPALCTPCLHNRRVIAELQKERKVLASAMVKFAPDIMQELTQRYMAANQELDNFIEFLRKETS